MPHAPLDSATAISAPWVVESRARRMCAPLSPSAEMPQYLNDMCPLSGAAAASGAAASESARIANVAESWSALNVPLSVRTESVTGRPAGRVNMYRADGVVMITRRTTSPESGAFESNASCWPPASLAPSANASDTQNTHESLPKALLRITSLAASLVRGRTLDHQSLTDGTIAAMCFRARWSRNMGPGKCALQSLDG